MKPKLVKVVRTSKQARISIPTECLEKLQLGDYVLVEVKGNYLEVYPVDITKRGRK